MDSFISRWEAIGALTDTNLKRNVDSVHDGDANRTRRAAQRVIAQLPSVDAVPMEWLEWRIAHAKREGFAEVAKMFETVREWWNEQRDLWQEMKEQEANDG